MSNLDNFFAYNLPIQAATNRAGETRILLYLPRKERLNGWADLSDILPEGATREQFFNRAADIYENLAKLMRHAATEPKALIYYPDGKPTAAED
tara:strand:+ start:468 stop:749 length:282 start_codon:yes stop_codon:yes gene_type:complete